MVHYNIHEELKQRHSEGIPQAQAVSRSVHAEALRQVASDEQEAGLEEPYFPTADEAVELNQTAHELYKQPWGGVRAPNELESAINRAQQHWHYGYYDQPDDNERLLTAAAKMAYGVGMNQPFVDGNKRTAFWLARHFLDENGMPGVLPPGEDDEFADHLIGHGSGTHSEDDTINLLLNRYRGSQG